MLGLLQLTGSRAGHGLSNFHSMNFSIITSCLAAGLRKQKTKPNLLKHEKLPVKPQKSKDLELHYTLERSWGGMWLGLF